MSVKGSFHVLELLLGFSFVVVSGVEPCYYMKLLDFKITDTPDYLFHMEFNKNHILSSVTRVLKDIPIPVWHIQIVQHSNVNNKSKAVIQQDPKVLYNATYKTCEFWKYVQRIRVFNNVAQLVLSKDNTNLSLSCPLRVGTYIMRNIHVPPDTGLLRFMYWPNTVYTLFGNVYSQLSDKSLIKKCSYSINGTVLKTC